MRSGSDQYDDPSDSTENDDQDVSLFDFHVILSHGCAL
jgi:hypothetical protein